MRQSLNLTKHDPEIETMAPQSLPDTPHDAAPTRALGAAAVLGFGSALLVGVVSWLVLLLDRNTSLWIVGALGAGAALLWGVLILRGTRHAGIRSGVIGGLVGAAASLLFTGSLVVRQPETIGALEGQNNRIDPAGLAALGVITLAFVSLGALAALLAPRRSTPCTDWRSRFAWVTAASYLALILVGGIVTGTESGLAVPDAVTTYGSVSILFPLSLMDEVRIYLEHSHRIFGAFAGLATIVLASWMFVNRAGTASRVMALALLVGVIVQGVMGALRVSEQSQALAALHGVLAQLVFALAVVLGVVCAARFGRANPGGEGLRPARSARLWLAITTGALLVQLVFGSLTRHSESDHPLLSHIGFSFVVVILAIIAGAKAIRAGKGEEANAPIRPYGALIHGVVVLQFTLGWGALAMTRTGEQGHAPIPTHDQLAAAHSIRVPETIITSAHHVLGALLLAGVVSALAWSIRLAIRPKSV